MTEGRRGLKAFSVASLLLSVIASKTLLAASLEAEKPEDRKFRLLPFPRNFMIFKYRTESGEVYVYMNGSLIYKRYPTVASILFEKYGPPTRNTDRDNGSYTYKKS